MELAYSFLRSIFMGFSLWTFMWIFVQEKNIFGKSVDEIDRFATGTVMVLGIFCFLQMTFSLVDSGDGISVNQEVATRAFGKYWFGWWIYPFTYFGVTQLFWVNSIRRSKGARIFIALFIFAVINIEHYIILMASLHGDFSPFPTYLFIHLAIRLLTSLGIFFAFVFIGLEVKRIIRPNRQ